MKILVCAKQVPNTNNVRIDPVKGTLIREGVESILNPDDANAVEAALRIKDAQPDTTITVISMGPPQAKEMLIECIAMGCDDAILLSDRAFGGSDTWATSNAIAAAIRKVGNYDLILAGRQAIDGDTAQVAPQTAEKLNIPQITYVQDIKVEKDKVIVQRQLEDGYEVIEAAFPCMLTCIKELNTPRYMRADRIIECYVDESAGGRIQVWGFTDVEVPQEKVGLKSSPTNVFRSFTPAPKGKGVVWTGMPKELAGKLNDALREKHIVA
jgi:electron transfer flavoprotein beta subunit